jgi:hypothetical protein
MCSIRNVYSACCYVLWNVSSHIYCRMIYLCFLTVTNFTSWATFSNMNMHLLPAFCTFSIYLFCLLWNIFIVFMISLTTECLLLFTSILNIFLYCAHAHICLFLSYFLSLFFLIIFGYVSSLLCEQLYILILNFEAWTVFHYDTLCLICTCFCFLSQSPYVYHKLSRVSHLHSTAVSMLYTSIEFSLQILHRSLCCHNSSLLCVWTSLNWNSSIFLHLLATS